MSIGSHRAVPATGKGLRPQMSAAYVMTDHPAWVRGAEEGAAFRVVRCGTALWMLSVEPTSAGAAMTRAHLLFGACTEAPLLDIVDPAKLAPAEPISTALLSGGTVARWRNPDLWDAVAAAVLRQSVEPELAQARYRELALGYGTTLSTPGGTAMLLPAAPLVADLPDTAFADLGGTHVAKRLRSAARACRTIKTTSTPSSLVNKLGRVYGIGPWTTGAAVCDATHDFTRYPDRDRTLWAVAHHFAPQHSWPGNESALGAVWRALISPRDLSAWTLLALGRAQRHLGLPMMPS